MERMPVGEPTEKQEFDTVAVIVKALSDKFGDDAIIVAKHQSLNASVESKDKWESVVSELAR